MYQIIGALVLQDVLRIGIIFLWNVLLMMSLQHIKKLPIGILLLGLVIILVPTHYFYTPNLSGKGIKMYGLLPLWLATTNEG